MLEFEKVKYLLSLPKKVKEDNLIKEEIIINQDVPFVACYVLVSEHDEEYSFLYDIKQSRKNHFKLSLYLMDNDTRLGLIRIDYNGQHSNPDTTNEYLPSDFLTYTNKFFGYNEPHIHYYVEGYKPLAWAIPLSAIEFDVQNITSHADVMSAFGAFNSLISLQTHFIINPILL
jgi:hypothetical protein